MGLYMYVTGQDRVTKRKVTDKAVNEEFQEALKFDPSLMIEEIVTTARVGIFRKKVTKTVYFLYHESPAYGGEPYQARMQQSGSGEKGIVIAYLHGIINGCTHANRAQQLMSKNNTL